jgi:hypothetical protein
VAQAFDPVPAAVRAPRNACMHAAGQRRQTTAETRILPLLSRFLYGSCNHPDCRYPTPHRPKKAIMVEIEYQVREQDLIAFNEHQLQSSAQLQPSLRRHQTVIPGILAVIALFLWFYFQDSLSAIYVGVTALAWGLLAPLYLRWSVRRQLRKMYSEADKVNLLGDSRLRIERHSLVEVTQGGESRVAWSTVLRIEATKNHAFIFLTTDTALVIPRATVTKGNLHDFIRQADERIEQAE